jgi:tetratricopeptide (TPR) repeat protein
MSKASKSGDIRKAIDHYNTTLSIAREARDRNMEQEACGSLASAYRTIANYPKAIEYLDLRMELALATEDRSVAAETSFRLGLCYYSLERYHKAIQVLLHTRTHTHTHTHTHERAYSLIPAPGAVHIPEPLSKSKTLRPCFKHPPGRV